MPEDSYKEPRATAQLTQKFKTAPKRILVFMELLDGKAEVHTYICLTGLSRELQAKIWEEHSGGRILSEAEALAELDAADTSLDLKNLMERETELLRDHSDRRDEE